AKRFDRHRAGRELLRHEYGKSLRAARLLIVKPSKHDVLIVEIVVQNRDVRGRESELLRVVLGALHPQVGCRARAVEYNCSRGLLWALRRPLVAYRRAIRAQRERTCNA